MRWSWRTWKALSLNATACLARTREIRDCQNVFIMIFCNINLLRQGRVLYYNRLYLKICKVENKLSKKLSLQLVHLSLPSNLRTRKSFSSRELCALTGAVKNEELLRQRSTRQFKLRLVMFFMWLPEDMLLLRTVGLRWSICACVPFDCYFTLLCHLRAVIRRTESTLWDW